MNHSVYVHKPLTTARSIRVLELYPDLPQTCLRCSLIEVSLDSPPSYDALSYAWGSPEPADEIICNDAPMPITANCSEALRHLRGSSEPRVLWIDSICIDQNDEAIEERSHQVGMMGDVYSSAHCVIVWLGDGNEQTDAAMRYLKELSTLPRSYVTGDKRLEPSNSDDDNHAHLLTLFDKKWFWRIWPVQEIILSRQGIVECGTSSLALESFMSAIIILNGSHRPLNGIRPLSAHISAWATIYTFPSGGTTLLVSLLLTCGRFLEATEQRDKIYAFHGILKRLALPLPAADYRKPVEDVYREATVAAITYDCSLRILYALDGNAGSLCLSSWVPDWSNIYPIINVVDWRTHKASSNSSPKLRYQGGALLHLVGVSVDRVQTVSSKFPWCKQFRITKTSEELAVCHKIDMDVYQQWKLDLGSHCAHLRMMDLVEELNTIGDDHSTALGFRQWLESLEASHYSYNPEQVDPKILAARELFRVILDRKVMFFTEDGRAGFASHHIHVGDSILLLSGCEFPMVARPQGSHWRLIAPAFVHGIMQGEMWPSDAEESLQEFTFC